MLREASVQLRQTDLEVRASVAHLVEKSARGTLVYLSIFDDELERRFSDFLAAGASPTALEPTDAVILEGDDGRLRVARGACCTFPLYRRLSGSRQRLATQLPVGSGAALSASGLITLLAGAAAHSSFEPNALVTTPLAGWSRLRRGTVTDCNATNGWDKPIHQHVAPKTEQEIATMIRDAFEAFGQSQRPVRRSLVELSGGYDSTLAAASARSECQNMLGVSVEFPYYEFRFEADVQRAVGAALAIERRVLDGTDLLPYSPWRLVPRFDEPCVFVTGIRHAESVGELAQRHEATRIYTGHGGDSVFAVDLTREEDAPAPFARGAFSAPTWRLLRAAHARIVESRWRERAGGCFIYDARQDVWAKERFGATVRTPFSDRALLRAGLAWSKLSHSRGVRPDKTILRRAVPELLPAAVVTRRGKVAYDGVWLRGYATHAHHVCETLERASFLLERIGFSPAWLLARCQSLARGEPLDTRELLAGYALASWLASWQLERASELVAF